MQQKKQFQDVVLKEKRSIRDIEIKRFPKQSNALDINKVNTGRSNTSTEILEKTERFQEKIKDIRNTPKKMVIDKNSYPILEREEKPLDDWSNPKTPNKSKKLLKIGLPIVVIVLIFIIMSMFSSSKVEVTPKSQVLAIDTRLSSSITAGEKDIRYDLIKLTSISELNVPAKGEAQVEEKATGKIVIYNNFSSEPQRLISRTRFETPTGLIYRIGDSVTVPGKTGNNPGSIEASVYADEAGEKYNITKTDFKIPGFKNDQARYSGFYARSVGDITGGFVGIKKKVSDIDKENATKTIQQKLKDKLKSDIMAKLGEDSILLEGNIIYDFKPLPQKDLDSEAIISEEATAYAIILNKNELQKSIMEKNSIQFKNELGGNTGNIKDFSQLVSTIETDRQNVMNPQNTSVNIKISGQASIVAVIDKETLAKDLAGTQESKLGEIMNSHPEVLKATSSLKPRWKSSFPTNPNDIEITVVE